MQHNPGDGVPDMTSDALPADLVVVGHVTGAFGIDGWIRIKPYSSDAGALLHARRWWLQTPPDPLGREVERLKVREQGGDVVVSLMGVVSRNQAEALQGSVVSIPRQHFPALEDNEFYWIDLIGIPVFNVREEPLGEVLGLIDNGAHPILKVGVPDAGSELLIPFVEHYVHSVDQQQRRIVVDWESDY
jgi:16S rRNA processing protein RimM